MSCLGYRSEKWLVFFLTGKSFQTLVPCDRANHLQYAEYSEIVDNYLPVLSLLKAINWVVSKASGASAATSVIRVTLNQAKRLAAITSYLKHNRICFFE